MTTPGGDIAEREAPEPQGPGAAARRGFDWVGLLAWCGAIAFAVALAGLPILVLRFGPLGHVLDKWWKTTVVVDLPEANEEPVAPLPGQPPETSGRRLAREGAVVVNPAWIVQPAPAFPRLAMEKGVEAGRVELQCPVSAEGIIESCWILKETPAGAGFGQAAVTGAARGRLRPRTIDGVPTAGMVRFSVNFRL